MEDVGRFSSLGLFEAGLALSGTTACTVGGFCIFRPDRVSSVGLYSGVELRDSLSIESEPGVSALILFASDSVLRLLFGLLIVVGVLTEEPATEPSVGMGEVESEDLAVRGPRLIPGLPRPSPLPDTTLPSSS